MKELKILQINESHFEAGGQERYFFDLINALREKGYKVYSVGFAPKARRDANSLVLKDTPNFVLSQIKRFLFDPSVYIKLSRYIKEIKPDIIHLHGINKSTFSVLAACRGYNTVMTVHNYGFVCPTIWCVYKNNLQICKGTPGLKCLKHRCINPITLITFKIHFKIRDLLLRKVVRQFITPSKRLKYYLQDYGFKNVVDI